MGRQMAVYRIRELVSPKAISKHDISTSIYGRIKPDSIIFDLIGFKRTDADEVDELKKTIPQEKLEAFFESELRQRYGISTADLNERYGSSGQYETVEEETLPFPSLSVRSWDALRKHVAEMLIYADPVRYEERIRSIRVSNHQREAKAIFQICTAMMATTGSNLPVSFAMIRAHRLKLRRYSQTRNRAGPC